MLDATTPSISMETKDINGTAKTNYLNAKRRLQRKNSVKETGEVLPTTTPATRRGGPRPSSGRGMMDMVSSRPGPGRERAPGPRREPAPRPHGAPRHEPSRVYLSNGGRTGPCACGTDSNSPPEPPATSRRWVPSTPLLLRLLRRQEALQGAPPPARQCS